MKCPFLIVRKDVYGKDGKKVGEEIETLNCIKNECMVFDGATKLCSLLSSNMKSGVLIDEVKAGVCDIKEEMYKRTDAMGTALSATVQALQEALVGRFDILKKQNEVMVLGFDRLVETITNKFENLKSVLGDLNGTVNGLSSSINTAIGDQSKQISVQIGGLIDDFSARFADISRSVGEVGSVITDLKGIQTQYNAGFSAFSDSLTNRLNDYAQISERAGNTIGAKLDTVRDSIEKSIAMSNTSMESLAGVIEKLDTKNQAIVEKLQMLDTIGANSNMLSEIISKEIVGIKTESLTAYNSILTKFDDLGGVFSNVISPGMENITKFMSTEISGLKMDSINVLKEIIAKLDALGNALATNLRPGLDALGDRMKVELSAVKDDTLNSLGSIGSKIDDLGRTLAEDNRTASARMQDAISAFAGVGDLIKADVGALKDSISMKFDDLGRTIDDTNRQQIAQLQVLVNSFTAGGDKISNELAAGQSQNARLIDSLRQQLSANIQEIGVVVNNLKVDQVTALNNMEATVMQLADLYKQSSDSLGSMSEMMRNLNSNYLESLSRIAGLAEGMRKGVDQVGKGMHDSVRDLVGEIKREIGALEKQYEKTFGDISGLASRFDELNKRIKEMTKEVENEFKLSFDRQAKLSDYTKTILEHMKDYFEKEDVRRKEEQAARHKREAIDHFDRAALYYYRGNYELALNEINKSLEIEQTAEYCNLKGLLLTELGKFEDSKKVYKEALKLEPNLAEIHNNLGMLYLKMQKIDDAVISFREAVKKNVNYANAFVNLGKALIDLEKFDEAIKAYEKALAIDPVNREANEAVKLYKEGKIGT